MTVQPDKCDDCGFPKVEGQCLRCTNPVAVSKAKISWRAAVEEMCNSLTPSEDLSDGPGALGGGAPPETSLEELRRQVSMQSGKLSEMCGLLLDAIRRLDSIERRLTPLYRGFLVNDGSIRWEGRTEDGGYAPIGWPHPKDVRIMEEAMRLKRDQEGES